MRNNILKRLEKLPAVEIKEVLQQYDIKTLRQIADRLYKKELTTKSQLILGITVTIANKRIYKELMRLKREAKKIKRR